MIECIFGILKCQWSILRHVPEYNMDIQAHIPAALCALHNFIQKYHPDVFDLESDGNLLEINHGVASGELGNGPADVAEWRRVDQWQERIAKCGRTILMSIDDKDFHCWAQFEHKYVVVCIIVALLVHLMESLL